MRIIIVSPYFSASKREILNFLSARRADLFVLPGACHNSPTPSEVQKVINAGSSVFVEGSGIKAQALPYLVTRKKASSMPRQVFTNAPSASEMDELLRVFPSRTFSFGAHNVSFILCGEIMAFNPDGTLKHGRHLTFDVMINPAHTMMGRWRHLGPKLSAISRKALAVHVANNQHNHDRVTTHLRVYRSSKLLDNRVTTGNLVWSECLLA